MKSDYKRTGPDSRPVHRIAAERALGRPLDLRHPVHHFDEDTFNNANNNLVICESASYHEILHIRAKILRAGFDPNAHKRCPRCEEYKLRNEFSMNRRKWDGLAPICKPCDSRRVVNGRTPEKKARIAERRQERERDPAVREAIRAYQQEYIPEWKAGIRRRIDKKH